MASDVPATITVRLDPADLQAIAREVAALIRPEPLLPHPAEPLPIDPLTVGQFAREVGRGKDWVYDQIRRRRIKPFRVGKPFQIPRAELLRLRAVEGSR